MESSGSSGPSVPMWTPPKMLNRSMAAALRTPGLERWLGRSVALITFTGRNTNRSYTTPVTYYRDGRALWIVTRRQRGWWRNLDARPEVGLRIQGADRAGTAKVHVDDPSQLSTFMRLLESQPRDAKVYGLTLNNDGKLDERHARAALDDVVMLEVSLES